MANEIGQGPFLVGAKSLGTTAQGRLEQDRAELKAVEAVQDVTGDGAYRVNALVIIGLGYGDQPVAPGGAGVGKICLGDCHCRLHLSSSAGVAAGDLPNPTRKIHRPSCGKLGAGWSLLRHLYWSTSSKRPRSSVITPSRNLAAATGSTRPFR